MCVREAEEERERARVSGEEIKTCLSNRSKTGMRRACATERSRGTFLTLSTPANFVIHQQVEAIIILPQTEIDKRYVITFPTREVVEPRNKK